VGAPVPGQGEETRSAARNRGAQAGELPAFLGGGQAGECRAGRHSRERAFVVGPINPFPFPFRIPVRQPDPETLIPCPEHDKTLQRGEGSGGKSTRKRKRQPQLRVCAVEEPERHNSALGCLFTGRRSRMGAGAVSEHPVRPDEKPWTQAAGGQSRSCLLSAG